MAFSEKQRLYLTYLLRLIGLQNEKQLFLYTEMITKTFSKIEFEPGRQYISYDECFKILKREIELKQYHSIENKAPTASVNATDLSSFVFCPASFSINKSFVIDYPTNKEEMELGTNYHSLLITAKKKYIKSSNYRELSKNEIYNSNILVEIKSSKLIYSGHSQRRPFYNDQENYYGDPDYIFVNSENGEKFIVEEKFSYKSDPGKLDYTEYEFSDYQRANEESENWRKMRTHFYKNHIVQLYSYIRNHPDKISYGYLIYWYYDFNGEEMYIHKYDIKKIKPNKEYEYLYQNVRSEIKRIVDSKIVEFNNDEVNVNKCVKCSVNKYCGHKTGRYSNLTFPYEKRFLRLFPLVEFPKELLNKPDEANDER